MTRDIFNAHTLICKECEFWRGACLKGHALQGILGCPLHKFEGVGGAGYMPDVPVPVPEMPPTGGCAGCGAGSGLAPMSFIEVIHHLMEAGKVWRAAGYPLATDKVYTDRVNTCKICSDYWFFQCRICRCCVMVKAKLKTEACPKGKW